MSPVPVEQHYAELVAATTALAALVDHADPDLAVPACPGCTLRQLATHVGRAHRWAGEIVLTRSAEFIEFRSVPDGRLPDDQADRGPWLIAGAGRLTDAIRAAGQDKVWAFGDLRPAIFWARRMAHETLVHGADAQLAGGADVTLQARYAADAIDEWLSMMSGPFTGDADQRADALPPGATIHVHATDPELNGTGEWVVARSAEGITAAAGHEKADVALTGPAGDLLLVLLRRLPVTHQAIRIHGDHDVLARWLENTSF